MTGSRRVLVTGADGFVGRHLVQHLVDQGWRVGALCLPAQRSEAADVFHADLLDARTLQQVPRRWDAVVHLAALSVPRDLTAARLTENVQMAIHLLEHLEEGRVLLVSSSLVYAPSQGPLAEGDRVVPSGPYGLSKVLVESLAPYYRRKLDLCIARPFNHVGPGMPAGLMIPSLMRRVKELAAGAEALVMYGANSTRDFVDVRDVVRAYELLLRLQTSESQCFNVCSGVGRSIDEVARCVLRMAGHEIPVRFETGAAPPGEVLYSIGSPAKLAAAVGWEPRYRLEDSLRAVWQAS